MTNNRFINDGVKIELVDYELNTVLDLIRQEFEVLPENLPYHSSFMCVLYWDGEYSTYCAEITMDKGDYSWIQTQKERII